MRRARLPLAILAAALLPGGASGAASAALEGCTPEALQSAWNEGYVKGVEDIKAQLAQATQVMQEQVQTQLNAQLGELQRQRDAEVQAQLKAAQAATLDTIRATPMPGALTGGAPAAPAAPSAPAAPAPTRMVIENPEALPPDLYAALMAYVRR